MSSFGPHTEYMKQVLDPEIFKDYVERYKSILPMREEVAEKVKDINPPGMESTGVECVFVNPWIIAWVRKRGGLTLKTYDDLWYDWWIDTTWRGALILGLGRKAVKEKPSREDLIRNEWLGYLSVPPTYLVRADLSFASTQLLYGKYATVIWAGADYFRNEFNFFSGYHLEEGVPMQSWTIALHEEWSNRIDDECWKWMTEGVPFEYASWEIPPAYPPRDKLPELLDRRHLRLGIKARDLPKKCQYHIHGWLRPAREIFLDLREEMFPKWVHATLYVSLAPGILSITTLQNFWGMSQWWNDPWICMNAERIFGWPIQYYTYEPLPPIINTLLALPRELWTRRLAELYLLGPKNLLCDAIGRMACPPDKAPLVMSIRRLMFDEASMYKGWAIPFDDGIPPPRAFLTCLPAPFYKEANIRDFVANPEKLPKEYWDLLEAEGGVDKKTGRIPPYNEFPRVKWLFDPTIEWLKPGDFPKLDWKLGQVWPYDVDREKMEIMVREGYDGSGKNILYYSWLADKKMGQEGKTIQLGTLPYKKPTYE